MSRARRGSRLRVLTYHRVAEPRSRPHLSPALVSATPETFERQMRALRRDQDVVSIGDVLAAVETGAGLPSRALLLTFDDAYHDLIEHAIPILRGLALPALVFVPTAFPGHPERSYWSDRLHHAFSVTAARGLESPAGHLSLATPRERRESLRRLGQHLKTLPHREAAEAVERACEELGVRPHGAKSVLDWDELRDLARSGIAVAAHSRSHALLTRLSPSEVRAEISGARADLERELGAALPVFCYPNGSHDPSSVAILREEGFRVAFTTLDGVNDLTRVDPLRLRRTNVTPRTGPARLRLRLTRFGAWLDAWRHRGASQRPHLA